MWHFVLWIENLEFEPACPKTHVNNQSQILGDFLKLSLAEDLVWHDEDSAHFKSAKKEKDV